MIFSRYLPLAIFGSVGVLSASPTRLRLTALISDKNQDAAFECWEIDTPFADYPTVGTAVTGLADVSNISYVVLPPRSAEGLHKPPHPMFFVLVSGAAHITLPGGDDELWIGNGEDGVIIAMDTQGVGHYTDYPSDQPSVALQIPFKEGVPPKHRVTNQGPCILAKLILENEVLDEQRQAELR
ncbi:hypothetical protein TruAng_001877 [Truncatella angustata]|nr:hypothetical protein TruAng_001877 [Truncatella angustata]